MNVHIYTTGKYLQKNPTWHAEDAPWKANHIINIIERNQISFVNLAEVGCGSGAILGQLRDQKYGGRKLVGFDISPDAEKFWPRYASESVTFVRADFLKCAETYDLILMIDVFEHVPDYIGFLASLNDRARYFVFHIPLDMHAQGVVRETQIRARELRGHIHYFSKATALATLKDCGYDVIDWFYTATALELQSAALGPQTHVVNFFRRLLYPIAPNFAVNLLGGYSMMVLARPTAKSTG